MSVRVCGYSSGMDGTLHRCWSRLLDGDRRWGFVEVRPDRFGVTRYRLVVYPPGISEPERRRVRLARGWPLWGVVLWIGSQILLSQLLGPRAALVISSALFLGSGAVVWALAGTARTQVRTVVAMTMAGFHDPISDALHNKLEQLAVTLLEADDNLQRGLISPAEHEMIWWRVYNQVDAQSAVRRE